MRDFYTFENADLTVGARSAVKVKVSLEVATPDDDEWAEEDKEEYINGMKVCGELQIDIPFGNTFIKPLSEGILRVTNDGESSRFPIVFIENAGTAPVLTGPVGRYAMNANKVTRYFWLFVCLKKPLSDELELFPDFMRREPLKVYTVKNFNGCWPLGVTCVVVAKDRKEGRRLLDQQLDNAGILKGERKDYDMDELDITTPQAIVLHDGNS